jgi:hypothetical protein
MEDHKVRGLEEGDLQYLSQNLRGADMIELRATYGLSKTPHEALKVSAEHSRKLVVTEGASGNPMFIYGLADWTERSKLIWACGTPEIAASQYTMRVLKRSRRQIGEWFEEEPSTQFLINRAHSGNLLHLKWLRWCHAEILPSAPYGPLGQDFHQFIIRRSSYV